MIISGIFGLGAFSFSFVLLKSQDYGIAANDIPLVYAAINVAHTIIGIPAGILGDKIGKEKVLVLGFLVFVISSLPNDNSTIFSLFVCISYSDNFWSLSWNH